MVHVGEAKDDGPEYELVASDVAHALGKIPSSLFVELHAAKEPSPCAILSFPGGFTSNPSMASRAAQWAWKEAGPTNRPTNQLHKLTIRPFHSD